MTNDTFENHSASIESQLTKASGYVIRGPWTHQDTAAVLQQGEIAVTEYKGVGGRAAFVALVNASVRK